MQTEELMHQVKRLELATKRRSGNLLAGRYQSAFKGQGIEFAEVREYEPGDDVRSIDWNVTARAGKPFIKRFVEERQLTVVLAVDTSASGLFGSTGRSKSRALTEAAAAITLAAERNGDRTGLVLFSDEIGLVLPPARGPRHQLRLFRELLAAEPSGAGRAMPEALEDIRRVARRHALVFLLSDFTPPPGRHLDELHVPLSMLSRRCDAVCVRVTDPLERDLPPVGLIEVNDPETGRRAVLDTSSKRTRRHVRERFDAEAAAVRTLCRRAGADLIESATDRDVIDDLVRLFRKREQRR